MTATTQMPIEDYLSLRLDPDLYITVSPEELAPIYGLTIDEATEAIDWADYERHLDEDRLYGKLIEKDGAWVWAPK